MFRRHRAVYIDSLLFIVTLFIVTLIYLLFFVCLLPGIHSGEIKIFNILQETVSLLLLRIYLNSQCPYWIECKIVTNAHNFTTPWTTFAPKWLPVWSIIVRRFCDCMTSAMRVPSSGDRMMYRTWRNNTTDAKYLQIGIVYSTSRTYVDTRADGRRPAPKNTSCFLAQPLGKLTVSNEHFNRCSWTKAGSYLSHTETSILHRKRHRVTSYEEQGTEDNQDCRG